ncbi:3-hydroxyacyl-CoA dehydrogenase/enoyl-CoA hydratase family protein [Desulforhopalus singaporensis]|uniref:enoyl-CoA hydratase n=1 Tax=Desulforhopalus singaporensis TaxID=91360 RepID=A0A1H0P152_9BACT|nr:3-hydroxyacyl-CoA dehydrogenase/enoyl-CoA hydratase family protein [Desulforhopalus singaporensis]SDO98435.1 enoyl-CoA hydratase / 3-hydroxyacyl-CoA dehydrogenase [Desulforhopalus singaporensis]
MSSATTVGVVGAGNMGSGIAQKLAMEGVQVILADVDMVFVERGKSTISRILQEGVERRLLSDEQMQNALNRIAGTANLGDLKDADMVIEAIYEDEKVKTELFTKLDAICSDKTILATNTSSFYVRQFAEATSRPDRFVGMHYFFHPAKNRLLEVIPHEGTSPETIKKSLEIGRLHGKTTICVKDASGFCVNRFFSPLLTESVQILDAGIADIPTIEAAAKAAFKIGMGPFELMNVTGIPISVHASATFGRELGSMYGTPESLPIKMEQKDLYDLEGTPDESKFEIVQDRLYGACLGAAAALVSEGVASVEDTDRGAKIGLRWRQGPFEIMNRLTIAKSCELVEAMTKIYPDFTMPEILLKQRETGKPFSFQYVDYEVDDGIAFITINRPEAMNALNEVTVNQLDEKFALAEGDDGVKAIVLRGAGKAFVAGADIRYFINNIKKKQLDKTESFTRAGHELFLRIENSEKITVAVLDGLSLGGGSELALACQAIVATPSGSMGFPETAIGIFPGLGGMIRSARHIGTELAKYYVFSGRPISAQDAYDLGIVTRLVAPEKLDSTLRELCNGEKLDKYHSREIPERFADFATLGSQENIAKLLSGEKPVGVPEQLAEKTLKSISRKAPIALKLADELINAQQKVTIPEAIELELKELHHIFSTEDALTGLTSAGRGIPQYQGK